MDSRERKHEAALRQQSFMTDTAIIDWFGHVRKDLTKRGYTFALKDFCSFTGKTPTELRNLRLEDLKSTDPMAKGQTETLVKTWYTQLKGAPRSKAFKYFAIRSFYANTIPKQAGALDIDLVPIDMTRVRAPGKPTLTEVRALCQIATVRVRAMIMWETKTGCRPETSVKIRMKDVDRTQGFPWIVYPKQTKSSDTGNITYADEECGEAMLVYWKDRRVGDEPDLPIFTQEYEPKKPMNADSYSHAVSQVMTRAKQSGIIRAEIRPYGLRKLFQTELERAKISDNWIKRMMCHSMSDVESAYSQAELDEMREAYRSAINQGFLRVSPQAQTPFTEDHKKMMRGLLETMRVALPEEFERMKHADTLSSGPDSLVRVVFREMEQRK